MNRFTLRFSILIFAIVFLGNAQATSICEGELRPIAALVRLFESALKLGDLDAESLAFSTLNGPIRNPFARSPKSIGNLSLMQSFDRHWHRVKTEHYDLFRASVRAMLEKQSILQAQVQNAKLGTKEIPGIQLDKDLDEQEARGTFIQGVYQERPVFVGRFKRQEKIHYFLVDEYHSDPRKRFVQLGSDPIGKAGIGFSGTILKWKGRDLFVSHQSFKAFDLESGADVSLTYDAEKLASPLGHKLTKIKGFVFPVANSLRFVSSWDEGPNPLDPFRKAAEMVCVEIQEGKSPKPYRLFKGNPESIRHYRPSILDGQFVLPSIPKASGEPATFFDLSKGPQVFYEISPDKDQSFESNFPPLPYSLNEKWMAIIKYKERINGHLKPAQLGIYDMRSKQWLRDLNIEPAEAGSVNSLEYLQSGGRAFAIIHANNGQGLLDLTTEKMLWWVQENLSFNFEIFHFNGETFAVTSSLDGGELQIRELFTGELRDRRKMHSGFASQIMTYTMNGTPMAFVTRGEGNTPIFLKLVRGDGQ